MVLVVTSLVGPVAKRLPIGAFGSDVPRGCVGERLLSVMSDSPGGVCVAAVGLPSGPTPVRDDFPCACA